MQLVALGLMVVAALSVRAAAGSWFHPSALLGAVWTGLYAIPTFGGLPISGLTTAVIGAVLLGAFATAPIHVGPNEAVVSTIRAPGVARLFVIGSGLAGAVSAVLVYRANGVPLGTLLDYSQLLDAATDITVRRYGNNLITPAVSTLLLAWMYAGAILAPFVTTGLTRFRLLAVLFAPILGAAFYALTTTVKAGLVIAVCNTLGAWIVATSLRNGGLPTLRPRMVLGAVATTAILVFSFVYLTAARLGGWTPRTRDDVLSNVLVYTGGGLPAFSAWQGDSDRTSQPLGWGSETLAGAAKYLLGDPALGSPYTDVRPVGTSTTNVYTILRPLAEDFGLAGGVLVLLLCSVVAAELYRYAILRRGPVPALLVSVWLGLVLFSSATSTLIFTSVCVGTTAAVVLGSRWISLLDPAAPVPEPLPRSERRARPVSRRAQELDALRRTAQLLARPPQRGTGRRR